VYRRLFITLAFYNDISFFFPGLRLDISRPVLKKSPAKKTSGKNKTSVLTLAECEWRAAAPGLKPLR